MLTARKRAFIDVYKSTKNAAESARRAGYSARTAKSQGSRLLTDVDVKREIEEFEGKEREKYSKDSVIDTAWAEFEKLSSDESPMARLRALELSAKLLGYLKSDNGVNVNVLVSTNSIERMREFLNKRGKIINPIETESKLDVNRTLSIPLVTTNVVHAIDAVHTTLTTSTASTETPADGEGQGAPATP